jgi:hypothetical protein
MRRGRSLESQQLETRRSADRRFPCGFHEELFVQQCKQSRWREPSPGRHGRITAPGPWHSGQLPQPWTNFVKDPGCRSAANQRGRRRQAVRSRQRGVSNHFARQDVSCSMTPKSRRLFG